MKKAIILCAALMLFTANAAFSTPVPELSANIDDTVAPADMQEFQFTRNWTKPDMPRFRFDFDNDDKDSNKNEKFRSLLRKLTKLDEHKKDMGPFPRPTRKYRSRNSPSPVPEPATMLLFGTGLVGLSIITRKKKKQ